MPVKNSRRSPSAAAKSNGASAAGAGRRDQAGPHRIWRLRRRHDHVDAVAVRHGAGWALRYLWNDRVLLVRLYRTPGALRAEARSRRRELERAGWTTHW
jgi:hypothetical protein